MLWWTECCVTFFSDSYIVKLFSADTVENFLCSVSQRHCCTIARSCRVLLMLRVSMWVPIAMNVLTVNHVFEVVVFFLNIRTWRSGDCPFICTFSFDRSCFNDKRLRIFTTSSVSSKLMHLIFSSLYTVYWKKIPLNSKNIKHVWNRYSWDVVIV